MFKKRLEKPKVSLKQSAAKSTPDKPVELSMEEVDVAVFMLGTPIWPVFG